MARHLTRLLWVALFFLATTMVFWSMLQSQGQYDNQLPWDRTVYRVANTPARRLSTVTPGMQNAYSEQKTFQIFTDGNFSYQLELSDFKPVPGGSSLYLKPPKSNRLWPGKVEVEDRLVAQMNHVPRNPLTDDPAQEKLILIYNGYPQGTPDGTKKFQMDKCPVRNCRLTEDRGRFNGSHAVVFQSGLYGAPASSKLAGQIWIMYMLESPENLQDLTVAHGLFNWTATYRRDSTINTPYERFVSYANATYPLPMPTRNYAEGKSKQVAWFVSNCYSANGRLDYAKQLQRFISVDIYGDCGHLKCYRSESERCNSILNEKYKFYLAFENSNCQDYITEKFYWNALYNDVVPIVMGARPEDYAAVAPPHSYIHVDDFESPEKLAEYLHRLDANDTLYNEYFRWKGTGEFIDTKYWCRLCAMVHESHNSAIKAQDKFGMWYDDMEEWWHRPGTCARPNAGVRWASWRNKTSKPLASQSLRYGPYPVS